MATRAQTISRFRRLPAFKGMMEEDVEIYLDLALEAVEGYAPKKVKMKGIPGGSDGSRYDAPEDARKLLAAYVTDTNIKIETREENVRDADGMDKLTYLLLQIEVPSWINLVRDSDFSGGYQEYPSRFVQGFRYGRFAGAGSQTHDLEYTVPLKVEDLDARQLTALRLYAEGEGYRVQATKTENLSDITDRDATGESTTLRRSQSGNAYQKLAESRQRDFVKEVARPYWSVDTFGLTEYLWSEQRL